MIYTKEQIENAVKSKGYVWFDGIKDYDVNIVGIRNSETDNKVTNMFDDVLTVSYKINNGWIIKQWPITTDPGTKAVKEYGNSEGVARLMEGQYRKSYALGKHKNKYEALKQVRPVKVYRDPNKDMVFDENKINEGLFGINIHKAGDNSNYVENWSEGCQVFKKTADFEEFMNIIRKAIKIHGNSFTYTLIESSDIH